MKENLKALFEGDPKWTLTLDQLLSPWVIGLGVLWVSTIIALGCFISSSSTVKPTKGKKNQGPEAKRVSIQVWDTLTGLFQEGATHTLGKFWKKLPRRMWNFYIVCLLIPGYRTEWGKYRVWSYRSMDRPVLTEEEKEIVRNNRKEEKLKAAMAREKPRPLPHNHSECERIKFNINGTIFETQLRTLNRFPNTLLGNPEKRVRFFDPATGYHYFDRMPMSFEAILYFYQSGGYLRRPENVHLDIFYDDAEFYELPPLAITNFKIEEGVGRKEHQIDDMPKNLLQRKIWLLFDYPESSIQARVLAIISVFVIVLSISLFCIETFPEFSGKKYIIVTEKDGHVHAEHPDPLSLKDPFFFTETVCSIWFTVEFLARFASSPSKLNFVWSMNNIIDCLSVVPYFVTIITVHHLENGGGTAPLSMLRVIRLVRVFRIFKLSRHSRGLQILGQTLSNSMSELFLLIFFVFLGIIMFSSCLYFAEQGEKDTNFTSIPDGFWFAVITMTTVGFGDMVPRTVGGKIVGSLCAITGVLTIALPVPVIVSNFNYFYHQSIDEQEFTFTKLNHVDDCPFRPSGGTGPPPVEKKGEKNVVEVSQAHGNVVSVHRAGHPQNKVDSHSDDTDEEIGKKSNRNRRSGKK